MSTIKNEKLRFRLPALVPVLAGMLFIFERVLLSATTAPTYGESPRRYIVFMTMRAISMLGVSLLPLWLGYHRKLFQKITPSEKLGKLWIVYVIQMLLIFIFFYAVKGSLNIRNLLFIFFPISKNYFSFSVGFIITFLLAPKILSILDQQSDKRVKQTISLLTLAAVVVPTIFANDVWNFNYGKSFLWQIFLFCIGYSLYRFKILDKKYLWIIQFIISLLAIIGAIFMMTRVSMMIRGNVSTAGRFSLPYTISGFYLCLTTFIILEKIQQKIKWSLLPRYLMIYLVSLQVIVNSGHVIGSLTSYYREPMVASLKVWLIKIAEFSLIMFGFVSASAIIIIIVTRIPFFRHLSEKMAIRDSDDFFRKFEQLGRWLKQNKRLFITIGFFYLLMVIQMFVVVLATSKAPKHIFLENMIECQPQLWLNVGIMMMILVFVFLLINRFWYAVTFTVVFYILLTISSYLKLVLRQEPVLPADMVMLTSIGEIVGMVQPTLIILGIIAIVILAIAAWLLQRHTRQKYNLKLGYKKRIIGIFVILVMSSGVFFINHRNTPPNLLFRLFNVNNLFFAQTKGAQTNGPLVQFLINIDVKVMDKPEGYSEKAIQNIMTKYDEKAKQINEERDEWASNQTVIFNLSESFSDPSRMPETTVNNDPIPNVRKIKSETTSGLMLTPGYGGGTANIEWETLTGLTLGNLAPTLATPYSQLVDDQDVAPNFTNLFERKVAIHPYVASLYNRKKVFDKFGFDAFYYEGSQHKLSYTDKISGAKYISDESAYKEVLKLINEEGVGSQFIQLSSMQNHAPYTISYPENDFDFIGPSVAAGDHQALRTYMQGIHYTDKAVQAFLDELDKIEKPITFVFYGDHLPSLYSGLNKSKYGLEMHETDYFVYNNAYSRKHSKFDVSVISPNYFSALALKQAGIQVTPYYALMTELLEKVPPMTTNPNSSANNKYNGSQVFVTEDGKIVDEDALSDAQKTIMDDYRMIQYDLAVGHQYAADWATQTID